MEFLTALWLPIVLSAVFVFVVSSVIHMCLPIHRGDFKALPDEAAVLEAMRAKGVTKGAYMFPCAPSMKEKASPGMLEKYKLGPVGSMVIIDNAPPPIGKSLVQWVIFSLLVGVFVAYASWVALGAGAGFLTAFRVTGTMAILAYGVSSIPDSIWKGQGWRITLKYVFDGVLYGLTTGATFGWLWPAGAA